MSRFEGNCYHEHMPNVEMSLDAYRAILIDWEMDLKADIAYQYGTMKARRMVTRTKLTKTISCLRKSLKGTSINLFEIKNYLKTVYTLREDLEKKDLDCQILMTDQMEVLDADSEISQQGWMEPALKVISRAQTVIAQLASASTVKGTAPGVSKSSMVNLQQFYEKLACCHLDGNICHTDGQSPMDCHTYVDAEGTLYFECLDRSSATPTTQTKTHLKTRTVKAQCRGKQEALKTTADGALNKAWVSKEVKGCLKMMDVDSEPRSNEGKLDDGQFALDCEVKFARSSLIGSHEQEMERCTYFAQLQDTVAHAVTTPIAHLAVATGNTKTYTVETDVMNGPVTILCVERGTTLEEFNGNFASPIGFANEAHCCWTRMLINKQGSAAACFDSRGYGEEFAQSKFANTHSWPIEVGVQEQLCWTKKTKDGAIAHWCTGPPSPNSVNIQELLTWIAVIAVFTLVCW